VLAIVGLSFLRDRGGPAGGSSAATVLLMTGTLAAVAGSRLLAPGAALAASRRVAAVWWLAPSGRLIGALFAILPVVAVSVLAGGRPGPEFPKLATVTTLYAAAAASLVLALAPLIGASAAAAFGFVGAWLGMLPPSGIHVALDNWPVVQKPAVWLWNMLPLGWRANRLFEGDTAVDAVVLLCWVVAGVTAAAWATMWVCPSERVPPGGAQ